MAAIESPDMSLRLKLPSDLGWYWCERLLFERDANGAMIVFLRKTNRLMLNTIRQSTM
jgi:hypothetical protein